MRRTHRPPTTFRISEATVDVLKMRAARMRTTPSKLGADLLEHALRLPYSTERVPITPTELKELLFRSVYATRLFETVMQRHPTIVRSTREAAEVVSLLGERGPPPPSGSGEPPRDRSAAEEAEKQNARLDGLDPTGRSVSVLSRAGDET